MTLLEDFTHGVMEEIADSNDIPLGQKQARYVAACLIVGLLNRGWDWHRSGEVTVSLQGKAHDIGAATVDQVEAFLNAHAGVR